MKIHSLPMKISVREMDQEHRLLSSRRRVLGKCCTVVTGILGMVIRKQVWNETEITLTPCLFIYLFAA